MFTLWLSDPAFYSYTFHAQLYLSNTSKVSPCPGKVTREGAGKHFPRQKDLSLHLPWNRRLHRWIFWCGVWHSTSRTTPLNCKSLSDGESIVTIHRHLGFQDEFLTPGNTGKEWEVGREWLALSEVRKTQKRQKKHNQSKRQPATERVLSAPSWGAKRQHDSLGCLSACWSKQEFQEKKTVA